VVILFSASLLTLSILSETTLISEIIFAFNSSRIAAFVDSDLAMGPSVNFSFSYLSSDFKLSIAQANLESIVASKAAVCLADSADCLLLSAVNFASNAAVCLAHSADCLLLSAVNFASNAAVCLAHSADCLLFSALNFASNAAICLAHSADCLLLSAVNFASNAAVCLAHSADCLLLSAVNFASKAAACFEIFYVGIDADCYVIIDRIDNICILFCLF